MSVSVDVFVTTKSSIKEIIACVEQVIGHRLERVDSEEGEQYKKSVMGIEIVAFNEHGLADDVGIEFSRYPIQVSFTRYAGAPEVELLTELCRILAFICASTISRVCNTECIVVGNLQHIIASFPKQGF